MRRSKLAAILAATILVLVGCGGSATTSTGPAATTEGASGPSSLAPASYGAPAASPSPDLPTLAAKYTSIASSGNVALAGCKKDKAAAVGSLAKSKVAAQECLTAYSGYVDALKGFNWGPVQPQADRVIGDMDKIDALMGQMIGASDATAFKTAYDQLGPLSATLLIDANAMRGALGLPPTLS